MTVRFKATSKQLSTITDICKDIAQITLASWVIVPLVEPKVNQNLVALGLLSSLFCWYIALSISRLQDIL